MKVVIGRTGTSVDLTGDEVATAIDAYLTAHRVHVVGPRTINVTIEDCGMHYCGLIQAGSVYVDPSGRVVDNSP